jgi:hypothetical protein
MQGFQPDSSINNKHIRLPMQTHTQLLHLGAINFVPGFHQFLKEEEEEEEEFNL